MYDTETGKELALLSRNREGFNVSVASATGGAFIRNSLAFSHDGTLLASGNMAGGLSLSDLHNDASTQSLEPQSWRVLTLAFSPDGKLLASGSRDTSIHIYDVENRTKISTLRGHTSAVISLTFSEDSKTLVSGGADGTVLFWDSDKIVDLGR